MADLLVLGWFLLLGYLGGRLLVLVYALLRRNQREGEREPAPFPVPAPAMEPRMTAEVVPLNKYRNYMAVRQCQGFIVLCEAVVALARFSPAQAEYYATEMTKTGFVTPEEQDVLYSLIAMERRDRPRAQGPLPQGWMTHHDHDGGPDAA